MAIALTLVLAQAATLLASGRSGTPAAPNDAVSYAGLGGSFSQAPPGVYDLLQAAGVRYVRIRIPWHRIEANPPTNLPPPQATVPCWNLAADGSGRDWTVIDDNICQAHNRGFSILANIHGTPNWASGSQNETAPPTAANALVFRDFVRALAERHGDKIAAFALWNEPNLPDFWTGTAKEFRDRILIPGYEGLQIAKATLGIFPAWAVAPNTYPVDGVVSIDPWLMENGMVVVDIDVLGVHSYGSRGTQKGVIDQANQWCNGHAVCDRFWVTEGGFTTASGPNTQNSTDANPGAALNEVIAHCQNRAWCAKFFIHHMTDLDTQGQCGGTLDFGLFKCDGRAKNRFCAVEAVHWPPQSSPCPCSPGKPGCTGNP
jgi:hypothetical protein